MINTSYDITLKVQKDPNDWTPVYTYENNRVSGPEWDISVPITLEEYASVRKATQEFIDLVIKECSVANGDKLPITEEIHEVAEIIADPDATPPLEAVSGKIIFDFTVGDLIVDITYDKVENKIITGSASEFDISWCDFIGYVRAWDRYMIFIKNRDPS